MNANGNDRLKLKASVAARRVARVYAEALLEEALARGQGSEVLDELEAFLREVVRSSPETEEFFASAAVGRDRKGVALRSAVQGQASDIFSNFLLVLNEHDRLDLLEAVAVVYREMLEDRSGQIRVLVHSAVPLGEDHQERLRQELRQTFRREPMLQLVVEPDILGGLVVRVGDWLYDASVRTRLETIRNQLLERSGHEIQVGRDRFSSAEGDQ